MHAVGPPTQTPAHPSIHPPLNHQPTKTHRKHEPPGAGAEEISKSMWDHDLRFLSIAREDIEDLTLQDVKEAVMAQMTTDATEVCG